MKDSLVKNIKHYFEKEFNQNPLMVFAPGRINLIGEHTDYNEGFVFPAAINKGIVTAFSKSDSEFCTAIAYDKNESHRFSLNDIDPIPNGNWKNYVLGVVSEIEKTGRKVEPFNVVFGGNIPDGAGLSSSAALENSIVFGLNELFNLNMSKHEMIFISQKAEHNHVGVRCGIMDQFASMFGVEDHAMLLDCRSLDSKQFKIDFHGYEIVLINSNVSHNLAEAAYNDRRYVCEQVASMLNVEFLRDATEVSLNKIKENLTNEDYQKALYIVQENKRVLTASKLIENDAIESFGDLLFEAHNGMQNQFKITCDEIDYLVDLAKENTNVIGARMMGGGFGGCTINLVKKGTIDAYTKQVAEQYFKKFNINISVYKVKLSQGVHLLKNN